MKIKKGMLALSLLLVMALIGAVLVPAVSAEYENHLNENVSSYGDIVGINTELKRSPSLFDTEGNKLSDKEISEMIEKIPKVTYLDGMTETESKKISERLTQLHQYRSISKSIDKVDEKTLLERTPPLLIELKNKGYSEAEIADCLLKIPKSYQKGWSEEDNERAISYFKNYDPELKPKSMMFKEMVGWSSMLRIFRGSMDI